MDPSDNNLENLRKKINDIEIADGLSLTKIFSKDFMRKYTDFKSIEGFIEESGYEINGEDDASKFQEDGWNEFVRENTEFDSWKGMVAQAGQKWFMNQIER